MTKITRIEFENFARQRIAEGLSSSAQFAVSIQQIFDFVSEHDLDDEANAYFDEFLNGLSNIMEHGLGKLADSSEKRKMLRLLALTKGKHHRADILFEGLGKTFPRKFDVVEAARPIFLATLQSILDVLFDATREPQHGPAQFAMLSMLY